MPRFAPFPIDRWQQTEKAILPFEVMQLPDCTSYLKVATCPHWMRVSFDHLLNSWCNLATASPQKVKWPSLFVAIYQLEKERNVAYITSIEQMGINKGLQQGLQQGESPLLRVQLEDIFGELPEQYQQQLTAADSDTLLKWGKRILKAKTLADVFQNS